MGVIAAEPPLAGVTTAVTFAVLMLPDIETLTSPVRISGAWVAGTFNESVTCPGLRLDAVPEVGLKTSQFPPSEVVAAATKGTGVVLLVCMTNTCPPDCLPGAALKKNPGGARSASGGLAELEICKTAMTFCGEFSDPGAVMLAHP